MKELIAEKARMKRLLKAEKSSLSAQLSSEHPPSTQGIFLMNTGNDTRAQTQRRPPSNQRSLFSTKVRIPVTGIRESAERVQDPRRPYDVGDPDIIRNNLEIKNLRAALVAKYK